MVPGHDPMGAPNSFSARRPNAPNLPSVELPPPPFSSLHHYNKPNYSQFNQGHQPATTLTSVGNLLTPPSNGSADGLSPTSSGIPTSSSLSSHGAVQPYTPGMWSSSTSGSTPYGFSQSGSTPQSFSQGRGLFSPSLNSVISNRANSSPTASEGLPPPPYEMSQYAQSMPMSAPSIPAAPSHHHMMSNGMIGGGQHTSASAPVSQASPVNGQEAFRAPPTPSNGYYSQQSTPQQSSFPFSAGSTQMQQSPLSAGGAMPRTSPVNQHGHVQHPQQQPPYAQHRPYSYPMPVLSNVNNPNGPMALVGGGMPQGMMPPFNSGHAAQMHQLYGHHPQPANPQNDRPFRCDQCPQSFNRNHDLKRHKRIHLAVKPFPCGHCDKSFSRKDALKRHVLVKGCGKAGTTTEVKEIDGSMSPEPKSESVETSPIVSARA